MSDERNSDGGDAGTRNGAGNPTGDSDTARHATGGDRDTGNGASGGTNSSSGDGSNAQRGGSNLRPSDGDRKSTAVNQRGNKQSGSGTSGNGSGGAGSRNGNSRGANAGNNGGAGGGGDANDGEQQSPLPISGVPKWVNISPPDGGEKPKTATASRSRAKAKTASVEVETVCNGLEALSKFLSTGLGPHWSMTDSEIAQVAVPAAACLSKIPIMAEMEKWKDPIALLFAVIIVFGPRVQVQVRIEQERAKNGQVAKRNTGNAGQNSGAVPAVVADQSQFEYGT